MIGTTSARRLERHELRRWLPQLDAWLLPGCFYGVQHTWPQLYRSDGHGEFWAITDGDRLLSHCAFRVVTVQGAGGRCAGARRGRDPTDPERRGQGLASEVLAAALAACDRQVEHVLLWAERPDLYARHGFVAGPPETGLALARLPQPELAGVRPAEVRDHEALHGLHEQKPWRVQRSHTTMSGLLTTPGMATFVRERDGRVVAYACCGKGADLDLHWHEVGGADADVATLLAAALHAAGQTEAVLLLPPYRPDLPARLGRAVTAAFELPGPMVRSLRTTRPDCWIDGLDSV
jgi:GNAT superfamily N-acetyltransferase